MPAGARRIEREEVEHVASLARVDLTDEERELFSEQLTRIVEYINKLDELDTSGVEGLASAVEVPNVLREDEPRDSLPREKALRNAPEGRGGFYRVPAVLD